MQPGNTTFDEIAGLALEAYEILEPRISFIRHSDNVTYKVATRNSEAFLLRIHVPITAAMGTHGADYEMANSEVTWLLALAKETDLVIPKPIRNKSGELVTRIYCEDGRTIHCTLLNWIEGEPYHRELESEDTAYQIGRLLATMHNQASQWKIPEGFNRPRRDVPYFENMLKGIKPAVDDGRISQADYAELSKSVDLLIDLVRGLDESPQNCGIIHADTHKGNMLYHNGEIRLIDFSFCAFGNYMFDLGVCFSDMKVALHKFCLEGYRSCRQLPENYQRLIEGFFLGSIVGTFSFWVANPKTQEILVRKVPQITQDYAKKFNQKEHFWF
ncbi:MAG: phosphotransferase [Anaerolineales bacterium]|nr:phosphotransferase [Anaerolineales bacterium]